MPDPLQILAAMALAFALAALTLLGWSWLWSWPGSRCRPIGEVIAIGIGLAAGCWWLGAQPHWPPREDLDRLLLIVLPAAGAVEIFVALLGPRPWIRWSLRLVVAAAAAPIVLYGSVYLTEAGGPGTRLWTPTQIGIALLILAGALGVNWVLLTLLGRRTSDRSLPLAVAVAGVGASATVMLSGYATGGQIGLPFSAALAGATCASLFRARPACTGTMVSLGIVGLFGLVIIGHFFGELRADLACLVFFAPLLAWSPELPYLRCLRPLVRSPLRLILTATPVAVALFLAARDFAHASSQGSPGTSEPSIQDYMDFGK